MPPTELLIHSAVTGHYPGRVPPFGYSRINAYLQLPVTFRSLSRPSSAISALASTLRSYSLDLCLLPFTLLRLLGELQLSFRFFSDSSDFFLFLTCAVFKVRMKALADPSKRYSGFEEVPPEQLLLRAVSDPGRSFAFRRSPVP